MSAHNRPLLDAPDRSYSEKLDRFTRFASPELRRILSELKLPSSGAVLDLGCGTGVATALLADALDPGVFLVGLDLSLPHLQAARHRHTLPLIQADAERLCFGDHVFDFVWCCNTVNHVADGKALLSDLKRLLKPGGRLALAQSGFLPEMFFAWDSHLDDAIRIASHRYYRERYGLEPDDTTSIRALMGLLQDAGYAETSARTYAIERLQPLSPVDREYFEKAVFEGLWQEKIRPYLDAGNVAKLDRNCDPESAGYWLNRKDFHHIQTITICQGLMIA